MLTHIIFFVLNCIETVLIINKKSKVSFFLQILFMKGVFMNELKINNSMFEGIKHIDEFGNEYWLARELQKVLKYSQ